MAAALGMSVAVSVLCLFAANVSIVPVSALCLFIASVMTWVPIREEHGYLFAAINYVLVTGVSLLICRGLFTYLYILIFGNYAFVRLWLRQRTDDRFLTILIRMLYFNVLTAVGLAFVQYVLNIRVMQLIPGVSVYLFAGALELFFAVYIMLYRLFTYVFDSAIRNKLLPRR